MYIVAIVVTHNPDVERFRTVIGQVSKQVNRVLMVDNDSKDKNKLMDFCRTAGNCDFVEVGFNSGVAHALRRGISYANRYAPDWLLFLDDDTILMDNAVDRALGLIQNYRNLSSRIGAVLLGSNDGDCNIGEVKYGVFSGTLIRADVAAKVCCRDEFFMDQADFDMYSRIRELGYLTLGIKCKLIDHKLGTKRWVPMLCRYVPYEPPWRYYYIVRNSTKLLLEYKMDIVKYILQLLYWGMGILLVDGPRKLIKSFGLGIIHALLDELGYIDSKYFK